MKYCTVMPHVISEQFQLYLCDVRCNPVNLFCEQTQSFLGHFESGWGNIEDADIFVSSCKKVINQR